MQDYNHIRQLLVKDHFGELTNEESNFLNHVLLTDPEARRIQQEIINVDLKEAEISAQDLDLNRSFTLMLSKKERIRKKANKAKLIYIASAAIFIGIAIFIYAHTQTKNGGVSLLIIKEQNPASKTILRTANGKQIILSDSGEQTVDVNGIQLANNNRVLRLATIEKNSSLDGWNTIIVPKKLDYRIELADGSTVWLNSTTQFKFPFKFDGKNREVFVENGEVYFSIAKKADQPFIVHTSQGEVRVLGTEFNVNNYTPGKVITSLVNGAVLVSGANSEKVLKPRQEAVAAQGKFTLQTFDVAATTSWRRGVHSFNDASIAEISIMLARWFDVELVVDDPEVSNIRFHANMNRNKPLSFFIETMNLTGEAFFYLKDGKLHCKKP